MKKPSNDRVKLLNSLRFKITASILLVSILLLVFIQVLAQSSLQAGEAIYRNFVSNKKVLLEERIGRTTDFLKTMVYDYTYWDDMVDFAANPSEEKANQLLAGSLSTYDADLLWVFNQTGDLVYAQSVDENEINSKEILPVSADEISYLTTADQDFTDFYLESPLGILEVHGASIHPTNDEMRTESQQGYLFVAKILDEEYVSDIQDILDSNVQIVPDETINSNSLEREVQTNGSYSFAVNLQNQNAETIAHIVASGKSQNVSNVLLNLNRLVILSIVIFIVIIIATYFLLRRWIISPLNQIQKALHNNDDSQIAQLVHAKNEFGVIARLTSNSLALLAKNEAIMLGISDGLILFDELGKVVRVNDTAQMLLEFREEELLQQRFVEKVQAYDQDGKLIQDDNRPAHQAITQKKPVFTAITYRKRSGTTFEAELSVAPILIKDRVVGALEIFQDKTQEVLSRHAIEKEVAEKTVELNRVRARLEASINSLDIGFIITGEHNEVVVINSRAKNILAGSDNHTSKTWDIQQLVEYLDGKLPLLDSMKKSLKTWEPTVFPEINFNDLVLRVFIGPVLASGDDKQVHAIGCVLLLEDVSESIIAARSKDEFFSIASHELRTPLTAIMGNSAMILEQYKNALQDKELEEMVDDIHTSSQRLISIVNDFLDVSKIELGKLKFSFDTTNFLQLCQEVTKELQPIAKTRKTAIKIHEKDLSILPLLWLDKDRARQILLNLIGNALKFTENGTVEIHCRHQGGFIEVEIRDTGSGISEDRQKLLFRKFQQAGTSIWTRQTSNGTGLGLYISKLLIEGMGGKIWLKSSKEGKGTIFAFTLPIDSEINQTMVSETENQSDIDTATGLASSQDMKKTNAKN